MAWLRRRTQLSRALVLLLAALTLATHVAIGVHEVVAQHVRCEHGELVDVELARGVTPPASAASAGPALVAMGDSAGHDHCALAIAPHGRLKLRHAPASSFFANRSLPLTRRTDDRRARAIPLLALAPKGSPPSL